MTQTALIAESSFFIVLFSTRNLTYVTGSQTVALFWIRWYFSM